MLNKLLPFSVFICSVMKYCCGVQIPNVGKHTTNKIVFTDSERVYSSRVTVMTVINCQVEAVTC